VVLKATAGARQIRNPSSSFRRLITGVLRDLRCMRRFACIFVCLTLVNVSAWFIHDHLIGGNAGIGKIENGKYYVGSHGHYTEVSREAFQFSRWHEASAVMMFLIAMFILLDMALSKSKWGDSKWSDCGRRKKRRG
jgi:hypothetical protein